MANLLTLVSVFLIAVILYAFRGRILAPFRRFERRNAERRAEEARALTDRYAHYRQTIRTADEQIEEVAAITVPDERTGMPVQRYLFEGCVYATREDAQAARRAAVLEKAREFYVDLDRIFLSRRPARRPLEAPVLVDPSKQETFTPPRM